MFGSKTQMQTDKQIMKKNMLKPGEQDGTGPSRRHIKGSKMKGLQSAKVLMNWRHFDENFFETMSHNAKKLKRGTPGTFQHPFCRKTPKNLRGTLWE